MLLNLDAGEHEDEREELWALFDVLNIACGGHAGNPASMERLVAFCARDQGPRAGAHPSYPDREHFGRRTIQIAPDALAATIAEQCATLATIARQHALTIGSVKPHGALYHDAATNETIAHAVLEGIVDALGAGVVVIGSPRGELRNAAKLLGLRYAREGFADRRMRPDGTLAPRSEPDALITDPTEAAAQATALAPEVDTICVHSDTPGAIAIARAVREALRG
ncbi:MAG: lactam utilization protein LamB [Myxococcales bacterium]|nr:lactam utilization protein LamB [Myxococcales bacterium]